MEPPREKGGSRTVFTRIMSEPVPIPEAGAHGVYLKWFGAPRTVGFTSRYDQWGYAPSEGALVKADRLLATLVDMRLPVTLDADDCDTILAVLAESMVAVRP